jgi:UV DNA damage endonuclease
MKNILGYCCINETLRATDVYTGRKLIRAKFSMDKASTLALQNVKDLYTIVKWNTQNGINVFRIGSEILPRSNDLTCGYSIDQLNDSKEIISLLDEIGKFAYANNQLLSFHPGAFVCLASPKESVRDLGIYTLERENEIANALCKSVNLDIPINFHIGGAYGEEFDKVSDRFCDSYSKLSSTLKQRVVLENDDKASCWSVNSLFKYVYSKIKTPITFDFHHYLFCNDEKDGINKEDSFKIALQTWGTRNMQVHYSQSPTADKLVPSHSDYYRDPIPPWIENYSNIHIHLECKAKELGLIKYIKDFIK